MGRALKYTNRYCAFKNYCKESQYICCFFCKKAKCKFRCKDYTPECQYLLDYDKSKLEKPSFILKKKGEKNDD